MVQFREPVTQWYGFFHYMVILWFHSENQWHNGTQWFGNTVVRFREPVTQWDGLFMIWLHCGSIQRTSDTMGDNNIVILWFQSENDWHKGLKAMIILWPHSENQGHNGMVFPWYGYTVVPFREPVTQWDKMIWLYWGSIQRTGDTMGYNDIIILWFQSVNQWHKGTQWHGYTVAPFRKQVTQWDGLEWYGYSMVSFREPVTQWENLFTIWLYWDSTQRTSDTVGWYIHDIVLLWFHSENQWHYGMV
jgi:hypothetical protein